MRTIFGLLDFGIPSVPRARLEHTRPAVPVPANLRKLRRSIFLSISNLLTIFGISV
jgi:hypothetical protein